ncbi:MAG TPA: FxsA family protein [Solirubrobacterales bacterium]|nr:FxsA family protein [Solirubrobacterales bacterium]
MLFLVIAFIVVPLAELYVIIRVGQWIGAAPTIALLLIDSVLGALLLRHQGRAAWRRFSQALSERRVPHREVFDGAMVIFGGALLLTPGFITDVVGLLCLIPPTRDTIRRLLTLVVLRRFSAGQRVVFWGADRVASRPRPRRPSYDVEGTAHEVPDEPGADSRDRPTLPP